MGYKGCGLGVQKLAAVAVTVACALALEPAVAQIPGQVTVTATRDNTLYEDIGGGLSNGAGIYLFTGRTDAIGLGRIRRALIYFDVAGSVPPEATITDATLSLQVSLTVSDPTTVHVHRVLANWGEGASDAPNQEGQGAGAFPGDATWVHTFAFTSTWNTPGGDYVPSASASNQIVGGGPISWTSSQLAADVAFWKAQPDSNFGLIVIGREDTLRTAYRFVSRDNPSTTLRPRLVISYTLPCPVLKTGDVNVDGNLTSSDIIGLVNYVFKGGATPQPCPASGDINCNGTVTSADVISIVNHVFKGGPAPCDVCTLIPGTWSCP